MSGMTFSLDGLVDGSDGGTCSNVEGGSREEVEEFGFHVDF